MSMIPDVSTVPSEVVSCVTEWDKAWDLCMEKFEVAKAAVVIEQNQNFTFINTLITFNAKCVGHIRDLKVRNIFVCFRLVSDQQIYPLSYLCRKA